MAKPEVSIQRLVVRRQYERQSVAMTATSTGSETKMKYLLIVGSEGRAAPEEVAVMQREIPGWVEEMERRGVLLLGRPLDLPETAATVRVRDGETLVTDGPFTEAKEVIAGFDLVECTDLDEAIEVAAKGPVSWFKMFEIRTFADGPWLGERASAFGRWEDGATSPYLLAVWTGGTPALTGEAEAWRQDLQARGLYVMGGALDGPDTATTLRVRAGKTLLDDGPFIKTGEFIAGIDVVSCADRQQAIQLAAAHPAARYHAIEVRSFQKG
jgi:hypothetical protein